MTTTRNTTEGLAAATYMVVLAVAVGFVLGVLTKVALWLYARLIELIWQWLPEQIGLDAEAFIFMAVVLVVGGVIVGLGQRTLGYLPKPLEKTTADIAAGKGIDYRTIPAVLGNTVPALGAGAPLGPESGLIAVIGGIYFWLKERMDVSATHAFRVLTGRTDSEASKPWRFAPSLIAGITVMAVFHWLPGGRGTSFVPEIGDVSEVGVLVLALVAGIAGGVLGIAARRLEVRVRALKLFEARPLISAPIAGLAVAVLAIPSSLVLFSGTEGMSALFSGEAGAGELLYAGGAKLLAMLLVLAAGWKGGTIFPTMFIAGSLAVGVADLAGLDPVVLYAGAIAGAVAGHLRSVALGAIISLLIVPPSLLVALVLGALGGSVALRGAARSDASLTSSSI